MDQSESRLKQLNEIREAVEIYESQLTELLQEFGWSKEKLPKLRKIKSEVVDTESDLGGSCSGTNTVQQSAKSTDLRDVVDLCAAINQKRTTLNNFTDLNKLRRDLKRRRVKYRTTKTAPLTYTEEMRELINLQMDLLRGNNSNELQK